MHANGTKSLTIAFIGGGNMAEAIIGGLCQDVQYRLVFSEPSRERRDYMQQKYLNVEGYSDSEQVLALEPQVVILAVKPQIMKVVMKELEPILQQRQQHDLPTPLLISIAAGISTLSIRRWLNVVDLPLIRLMPNTPALIGQGAVGCYAMDGVSAEQRQLTESLLGVVCKHISWVEKEPLMDAVTAVSGSGPAYYFLIMEAMQNAGVEAGLSIEDAKALTLQTCLGAARMAMESEDDLATLRQKVTSPKGTTEAALKVLEAGNIRQLMYDAVFAADQRSRELAEEFGKD
ncbi:pyrroline-5-carboxylate reductase [Halteromyces radiatus]|uniref:pyrroline-5-carboxylate reductase n=1 Tax=Halteromyces radiatus TaxID=101107 RepID=UPI00221E6351|nr:pyrroline-5-carboxylate reductase [Halteromyces radiatus]KAI8088950.1 pyrroline-5-carboxylate reductase [Halteromyces radiatus]